MITTSDYIQFREPTHDEFIANIAKAVRHEYENYHKHVPAEEVEQMVSNFPDELWEEKCAAYCTEDSMECVALSRKTYDAVVSELNELRKHEVEWDLAQARIKELEAEKNAKDEEINAVHQKSLARLEELVNKKYPDEEEDHAEADGILCDMLNALGYKDLTDLWDKIGKWYS